jgi:para-nitrobenzyl esterase
MAEVEFLPGDFMSDCHIELNRNFAAACREGFGRRAWLGLFGGTAAALAGASAASAAEAQAPTAKPAAAPSGPLIMAGADKAVVETHYGKVRGYTSNGIFAFRGMPYAQNTEGKNRFTPPVKPTAWTGIRSALSLPPAAPQPFNATVEYRRAAWRHDEEAFMFEWEDGQPGEDCVALNVWTPSINDNRKRPVMVWIHGGGFVAGSCDELRAYDGANLARRGDVVVVSMNHRLGALGYLNLADYGDRYNASANVGMLDLVASLEWVRDNISNFGGDPAKVFIFGQSGGGSKVATLLTMPAAKGLFHRASIQSAGNPLRGLERASTAKSAAEIVGELGLNKSNIDKILELPYYRIIQASEDAGKKYGARIWGATVDGSIVPQHPFDPNASPVSAGVPLMIGTVLNENINSIQQGDPSLDEMSMEELRRRTAQLVGNKADTAVEIFRKNHPKETPYKLLSRITGAIRRQNAIYAAERKAVLKAAPAYNYWFHWQTPVLDGRAGAYHTSELPFCFDNTDRCAALTGGGPRPRALAAKVADAWVAFAKNGDPNHPGLPKWAPYNAADAPVMIFDNECVARNNPDKDERDAVKA